MGKGRTPCCDKAGVKRGPWSEAEDLKLISFIHKHGHSNWRALPKLAGLARCGKSCRLRWVNYLRPDLRRGNFSTEEEETIIKLHESLGNKWSKIASHFPGRTDNEIKNVWNTHLKKRLKAKTRSSSSKDNKASSCTDHPNNDHKEQQHIMGESNLPVESSVNDENMVDVLKDVHDQVQQQDEEQIISTGCSTISDDQYYQCSVPAAHHDQTSSSSSTSFSSNNEARNVEDFGNNHVIFHDQAEMIHEAGGLIEIPFEPDLDLWNLLDDQHYDSSTTTVVDPRVKNDDDDDVATLFVQPGNDPQAVHQQENYNQVSHVVDSGSPEEEAGKGRDQNINESWQWWFGYLENELGLEATTTHQNQNYDQVSNKMAGPQQQPTVMQVRTCSNSSSTTTTADQELLMLINEDIEPVDSYFKSWEWPSSPNYMPTV